MIILQAILKILVFLLGALLICIGLFWRLRDGKVKGEIAFKSLKIRNFGTRMLIVIVGMILILIVISKGIKQTFKPDGTKILEMKGISEKELQE